MLNFGVVVAWNFAPVSWQGLMKADQMLDWSGWPCDETFDGDEVPVLVCEMSCNFLLLPVGWCFNWRQCWNWVDESLLAFFSSEADGSLSIRHRFFSVWKVILLWGKPRMRTFNASYISVSTEEQSPFRLRSIAWFHNPSGNRGGLFDIHSVKRKSSIVKNLSLLKAFVGIPTSYPTFGKFIFGGRFPLDLQADVVL